MLATKAPAVLPRLADYLSVAARYYEGCLAQVDHKYGVDGVNAQIRLHYVRCQNYTPKFKELAQVLANHLGCYALTAQRRSTAGTHVDHVKLFLEAKKLLRGWEKTGEPGELLLYFLIESVLRAPQAICKMSLKTNRKEEIKGSDGVHIRWDDVRQRLVVYFGEAKLYGEFRTAVRETFASMERFHAEGAETHELFLVSTHFNLLDEELKHEVASFIDKQTSQDGYDLCHACLVGFDWERYSDLDDPKRRKEFIEQFEDIYRAYGGHIQSTLQDRFKAFGHGHLRFEFFFIPFRSVAEFRKWFLEEVFGEVKD
jgi:hypothetical protein